MSFYDLINKPRFRSSEGESTEAGYDEDSSGLPLSAEPDYERLDTEVPHVQGTSDTNTGLI